jgi:hypothetical protein
LGDEQAAMAMKLDCVFACVTGRAIKKNGNSLIKGKSLVVSSFDEVCGAWRKGGKRASMMKHLRTDFESMWTRNTDDADSGLTHRSGDSGDGVGYHWLGLAEFGM